MGHLNIFLGTLELLKILCYKVQLVHNSTGMMKVLCIIFQWPNMKDTTIYMGLFLI